MNIKQDYTIKNMNLGRSSHPVIGSGTHRQWLAVVVIGLVTLLAFSACKKEEDQQVATSSPALSVPVQIDLNESTDNRELLKSSLGTVGDVVSIQIVVKSADEKQSLVSQTTLEETYEGSKVWEGYLDNIPVGVSLQFEASAYNADNQVIFSDTLITSLDGIESGFSNANITFEMESVDDGLQPDNPKIVSISAPDEVATGAVNIPISFTIEHPSEIEYSFQVEKGTLSTPLQGTHDPATELEILYNAPSAPGEDHLTIQVKDPESSDSVGAIFPITVVDSSNGATIGIHFGPTISGMLFVRGSDYLMVSVGTEPETGLNYQWSGTGSFADLAETGNPMVISSFTDDASGDISVTVTDDYGLQAELTRTIAAGDFPYAVTDPDSGSSGDVTEIPDGTVLDSHNGLLWQDNGVESRMNWPDAGYYCENVLDLGGYTDWRLPTLSELLSAYKNRELFSSYVHFGYWSSMPYSFDSSRAWSLRFSSGFDRIGKKRHKRMVRCVRDWQ